MDKDLEQKLKQWKQDLQEVSRKQKKRRRGVLKQSDIKGLMGTDKPVYRKYKGSYRQR